MSMYVVIRNGVVGLRCALEVRADGTCWGAKTNPLIDAAALEKLDISKAAAKAYIKAGNLEPITAAIAKVGENPSGMLIVRADEWDANERARREAEHAAIEAKRQAEADAARAGNPETWTVGGGSGYGYEGWQVGRVYTASQAEQERGIPEHYLVLGSSSRYIRDDGMSFGVGEDSGYLYSATVCAAEPDADLLERQAKAEDARADREHSLAVGALTYDADGWLSDADKQARHDESEAKAEQHRQRARELRARAAELGQ